MASLNTLEIEERFELLSQQPGLSPAARQSFKRMKGLVRLCRAGQCKKPGVYEEVNGVWYCAKHCDPYMQEDADFLEHILLNLAAAHARLTALGKGLPPLPFELVLVEFEGHPAQGLQLAPKTASFYDAE